MFDLNRIPQLNNFIIEAQQDIKAGRAKDSVIKIRSSFSIVMHLLALTYSEAYKEKHYRDVNYKDTKFCFKTLYLNCLISEDDKNMLDDIANATNSGSHPEDLRKRVNFDSKREVRKYETDVEYYVEFIKRELDKVPERLIRECNKATVGKHESKSRTKKTSKSTTSKTPKSTTTTKTPESTTKTTVTMTPKDIIDLINTVESNTKKSMQTYQYPEQKKQQVPTYASTNTPKTSLLKQPTQQYAQPYQQPTQQYAQPYQQYTQPQNNPFYNLYKYRTPTLIQINNIYMYSITVYGTLEFIYPCNTIFLNNTTIYTTLYKGDNITMYFKTFKKSALSGLYSNKESYDVTINLCTINSNVLNLLQDDINKKQILFNDVLTVYQHTGYGIVEIATFLINSLRDFTV